MMSKMGWTIVVVFVATLGIAMLLAYIQDVLRELNDASDRVDSRVDKPP